MLSQQPIRSKKDAILKIIRYFILIVFLLFIIFNVNYKVTAQSPEEADALMQSINDSLNNFQPKPRTPPLPEPGPLQTVSLQTHDSIMDYVSEVWDWIKKAAERTGNITYKTALRNFLSRVAYDTATELATGGTAKTPLFDTKFIGDFMNDVAETTLVDTLDILASNNGFFEFNICQPSNLDFSVALNYSLFNSFSGQSPHRPKCSLKDLQKSWANWNISLASNFDNTQTFLDALRGAFSPQETDIGIYLTLDSSIRDAIKDKKTQELLDRVGRQGLKPVTEPITKAIKTPASIVGYQALSVTENSMNVEFLRTGDIVADAVGIFTNTLASKLIERLLKKGLSSNVQSTIVYNWVNQQAAALAQEQQLAELAAVQFTSSQEPIAGYLSSCPNPNNPSQTECVISPNLITAIEQKFTVKEALDKGYLDGNWPVGWLANGVQPTYLSGYPYRSLVILRTHRIIPVGWELSAWYAKLKGQTVTLDHLVHCFEDTRPDLSPDSNPQVHYYEDKRYPEDCREDIDGDNAENDPDDYNPYYHLVDPNWVLKAPESMCAKKGAGYQILNSEWVCLEDNVEGTVPNNSSVAGWPTCTGGENCPTGGGFVYDAWPACDANLYTKPDQQVQLVSRNTDYCADWQTCLQENDDGSCKGIYGHCLKEKEFWRFPGTSCPAEYASCETLTRKSDNQQFSFLTNTLSSCASGDAGCYWYALTQQRSVPPASVLEWQTALLDPRVYLNETSASQNNTTCELDNVGCAKVARMIPAESGGNHVFNGGFESASSTNLALPADWIFASYVPAGAIVVQEITAAEQYQGGQSLHMSATESQAGGGPLARSEGYIPIDPRFVYQLSFFGKGESSARARVQLHFYDADKISLDTATYIFNNFLSSTWQGHLGVYGPLNSSADYIIPAGAKYARVFIQAPTGSDSFGSAWFDAVNLAIKESPVVAHNLENYSYATSSENIKYSEDDNLVEHIKLAPAYLNCENYNDVLMNYADTEAGQTACFVDGHYWREDLNHCVSNGDALCQEYAAYCQAEEVGCEGYTPQNGDPEVPAKVLPEDVCPEECAGYDSYIELTNYFEEVECPMYESQTECIAKGCSWNNNACAAEEQQRLFIPQTAQNCSLSSAGCEEFTNLDELSQGGEGLEYFTELRQCISPDNSNISYYYTWEGSDTTGYQLKKWEFLKSNIQNFNNPEAGAEEGFGPCTNIVIGTDGCADQTSAVKYCSPDDIAAFNDDCRDFFDSLGNHFYRWQNYAITASAECHPYRRTLTGQIYNADPGEATNCSASDKGCAEYKGNAGNNITNIISSDFESGSYAPWQNSDGGAAGLTVSNEAVAQGGHSLKVSIEDDILAYPLNNQLTAGKQYTLSFWAKKTAVAAKTPLGFGSGVSQYNPGKLLGLTAKAQGQTTLLDFNTGITNEWDNYQIGPISLETVVSNALMRLHLDNLSNTEGFYIDNIILKEYTDNFYVIKDSWQTPVSCDNNLDNQNGLATCSGSGGSACTLVDQAGTSFTCNIPLGDNSCQIAGFRASLGAQTGCLEYQTRSEETNYLKSFDYICSDTAIGCEAFINTQNSTIYQGQHTYKENEFICDDTVGVISQNACAGLLNPASQGSYCCAIRGQNICRTNELNGSCSYSGQTVPNDEIVYAVNDPEKYCQAAKQGCSRVGKPELDRQIDNLSDANYVTSTETVFLFNNPDEYDNTLCSPSGEFCSVYQGGASANDSYYFDPIGAAGLSGSGSTGDSASKTCYYSATLNKWLTSGTGLECPGNNKPALENASYLARSIDYDYQGWVGLCDTSFAGCTEYRDPQKPVFNQTGECDSLLAHQLTGVCNNDTGNIADGYCVMTINGVEHKVCDTSYDSGNPCQEIPAGSDNWRYSAYDWVCDLGGQAGAVTGADCCVGGTNSACDESNETKVCHVAYGQSKCSYSLPCSSYYYKRGTVDTEAGGCNGNVDREAGCLVFNDTSNSSLNYNSETTLDGQAPQSCPAAYPFTLPNDCDANQLLKVQKDRECAEWLDCQTSYQTPSGGSICTELKRCAGLDLTSQNCDKVVVSYDADAEITADYTDTNYLASLESVRFLSGYSRAGARWSAGTLVNGYYAPEQMLQNGEVTEVLNAGFEEGPEYENGAALPTPKNWMANWYDQYTCEDGTNANPSTQFSPPDIISCQYRAAPPGGQTGPEWNIYGPSGRCDVALDPAVKHSGYYSVKLNYKNETDGGCPFAGLGPSSVGSYAIDSEKNYNLSFYAKSQDGSQRAYVGLAFFTDDNGVYTLKTKTITPSPYDWEKFLITFGPLGSGADLEIPTSTQARIYIYGPNIEGNSGQNGSLWFDDFTLEPVLKANNEVNIAKDCRLFPRSDSRACAYQSNVYYQGWNGYCLEPDPAAIYNPNPQNPTNYGACLQWYPIDTTQGDPMNVFEPTNLGYSDQSPLYYCAQSEGNYNFKKDSSSSTSFTSFNSGTLTTGYKIQSHIHINDRINNSCPGGGTFSNNNNISLCLDENYNGSDNERYYCWWRNGLSVPAFDQYCDFNGGGIINPVGYEYSFDGNYSSDQYINLNNINSIYIEIVAVDGGWQSSSDFMQLSTTQPAGYTQYELDLKNNEGCFFWAWFNNSDGYLRGIKIYCDDGGEDGYGVYNIYYYMKESCTTIVQVVADGNEKVWLDRYDNGWQDYLGNNILRYSKDLFSSPYGSIISPDVSKQPDAWPSLAVPLLVYHGNTINNYYGGLPYSTANDMGDLTDSGRMCIASNDQNNIGEACDTSADCGTNGVCSGIGKYCFDNTGMITGDECTNDDDCGGASCMAVGHDSNSNSTANLYVGSGVAITDRIQNLFAKVYGVWQWDDAEKKYNECQSPDYCGISGLTEGSLDASDVLNTNIHQSAINSLKLNDISNDNIEIHNFSGDVKLTFHSNVDADQLPIETIYINWGDAENQATPQPGPYDHRPCSNPPNCTTLPHEFHHTYSCAPNSSGTACLSCAAGGALIAGKCHYNTPIINLKDSWGWCAYPTGANGWKDDGVCTASDCSNGLCYGINYKIIVGP